MTICVAKVTPKFYSGAWKKCQWVAKLSDLAVGWL